jgi:hypothetical protein
MALLIPSPLSEEFSIYLNYVRKLGFEETPDYDFLRELFAKVMKNNGDIDDQVYDWNLLNGIPSCFIFILPHAQCLVYRRKRVGVCCGSEQSNFATGTEHPDDAKTRRSRARYPGSPVPCSGPPWIQEGSISRRPSCPEQQPERFWAAHPSLRRRSGQHFNHT